jgi:hypothetical protein
MEIRDIDTDKIVFDWRCSEIKRFREKERSNTKEEWDDYWICDYRLRHPYINGKINNCDCYDKIKIYPKEFKTRLQEMWLNSDIPKWKVNEIVWAYKVKYFKNWEYM